MAKASFEVGEAEKHIIAVNANPFLKVIRVEVDGERVIDVANLQPSRKLQLDVGKLEKHSLEIDIRLLSPIRLFADGKEIQKI